jgi:translation initiation factor 4A
VACEREDWKFDGLQNLYSNLSINQCVIFCNTKKRVEELAESMTEAEHVVSCMHGEMDQTQRDIVMKQFRAGAVRVLITTDILARGIDV